MDRAALVNLTFCRLLLRRTFAEVRELCPQARARDIVAVKVSTGDWYVELLARPWYGGGGKLLWSGRADNAYHAKAEGWAQWLKEHSSSRPAAVIGRRTGRGM